MSKITKALGAFALVCLLGFLVSMVVGASAQACFGFLGTFLILAVGTCMYYYAVDHDEEVARWKNLAETLRTQYESLQKDLRAEQAKKR
jgi:high-affinity Fe2+/Pb2+ permease